MAEPTTMPVAQDRSEAGPGEAQGRPRRPRARTTLQERLENSRAGRALISAFIAAAVLAAFVSTMPPSETQRLLDPVVEPFTDFFDSGQRWNMFAPNPPLRDVKLEARLEYADGSVVSWQVPDGNYITGDYRGYRWRKVADSVRRDNNQDLWAPFASYVAGLGRRDGEAPVRVSLLREISAVPKPGSLEPTPERLDQFFTLEVTDGGSGP